MTLLQGEHIISHEDKEMCIKLAERKKDFNAIEYLKALDTHPKPARNKGRVKTIEEALETENEDFFRDNSIFDILGHRFECKMNILHVIAAIGKEGIAQIILDRCTDEEKLTLFTALVQEKEINGNSPLHMCAKYNRPAMICMMRRAYNSLYLADEARAKWNIVRTMTNKCGNTPLLRSAYYGSLESVMIILDMWRNDMKASRQTIKESSELLNSLNFYGRGVIHCAVLSANVDLINFLCSISTCKCNPAAHEEQCFFLPIDLELGNLLLVS